MRLCCTRTMSEKSSSIPSGESLGLQRGLFWWFQTNPWPSCSTLWLVYSFPFPMDTDCSISGQVHATSQIPFGRWFFEVSCVSVFADIPLLCKISPIICSYLSFPFCPDWTKTHFCCTLTEIPWDKKFQSCSIFCSNQHFCWSLKR